MARRQIVWGKKKGSIYFTIINSTSVAPKWTTNGSPLQYQLGGAAWKVATSGLLMTTGTIIRFRGTGRNSLYTDHNSTNGWVIHGNGVVLSGPLDTLLDYNTPPTSLGDYAFDYMFNGNASIKSVNIVMPQTVSPYCYANMFYYCSSLVNAPSLPATTLAESCYSAMFMDCSSLVNAPELPATILEYGCYDHMFQNCTFVNAPSLPATTLAESCYSAMFWGCYGLLHAHELLATTLAKNCCVDMFHGCISLVNAPSLPATTLAENCCYNMFYGCTSLVNAPSLPATTLAANCYAHMFEGCTSLVNAPSLPATTLVTGCYQAMFMDCSSLVNAPGNSDYTLFSPAQMDMFDGATNLVTDIPWCAIPISFGGPSGEICPLVITNSTSVTPTWTTSGPLLQYKLGDADWTDAYNGTPITTGNVIKFWGRSRTGLYNDDRGNPWVINGDNIIISGHLHSLLDYVTPPDSLGDYAFYGMFNGNASITSANIRFPLSSLATTCYGSMFHGCTGLITAPSLPYTTLAPACYENMFGGCTSLVNAPSLPATILIDYCYQYMFNGCTSLVNAPTLPATTLINNCYINMFSGCSGLLHAPGNGDYTKLTPTQEDMFKDAVNVETDIPWEIIPMAFGGGGGADIYFTITNSESVTPTWHTDGSLQYRLRNSIDWVAANSGTSITTGDVIVFRGTGKNALYNDMTSDPWVITGSGVVLSGDINALLDYENPPTSLGNYAFYNMFTGNASITEANIIMPQTVSNYCYAHMFESCTNLVNAPTLPATTLSTNCYAHMFSDCTNLVNAPTLPATTLATNCYANMFSDCTNLVNAPTLPATTLADQCYDSMFQDCTKLVDAPSLPATILTDNCYHGMFTGCNKLVNAPSLPATTLTNYCYNNMFSFCKSLVDAPLLPALTLTLGCYGDMFGNCTSLLHAPGNNEYTKLLPAQDDMFTGATNVQTDIPWEVIPTSFGGGGICLYFTITNSASVTPTWTTPGDLLQYQLGDSDWVNATSGTSITTGDVIKFRGTGRTALYNNTTSDPWVIIGTGVILSGDLDALLDYNTPPTSLGQYAFSNMFKGNASITQANIIMSPTVSKYCYQNMFNGCTGLVNAPSLPATTLVDHCYTSMFQGCTTLLHAPGNGDYTKLTPAQEDMFKDAVNVETDIPWSIIPETFGGGAGNSYFNITNSSSVTPTWTTSGDPLQYKLGTNDWTNAVSGTSITTGDVIRFRGTGRDSLYTDETHDSWVINGSGVVLSGHIDTVLDWQNPPIQIGDYAFSTMFKGDVSITQANIIMSPTVSKYCYQNMFNSCTSLVNAPSLPATTLAESCYSAMFMGCSSLVTAPALSCTTLAENCYQGMFSGCSNLVTAPSLHAFILVDNCYNSMFQDCTNLLHAPGNIDYTWYSPAQTDMFTGARNVITDISWCDIPVSFGGGGGNCPVFTITNSDTVTPTWTTPGDPLQYKLGDADWVNATSGTSITTEDDISFRGRSRTGLYNNYNSNPWVITGNNISISGRLDALLDYQNTPAPILGNYAFSNIFKGNQFITETNITMSQTVSDYCYVSMFEGCNGLLNAPDLPATTLAEYCYYGMFFGCIELVSAPELPATTLANNCYEGMFSGCINLSTAPTILPATTLTDHCYYWMFMGCTALINAPELPATTLANNCYDSMFKGCNNLLNAPSLPANVLYDNCYNQMFHTCYSLVSAPRNTYYTELEPAQAGMFTDAVNIITPTPWCEIPKSFGGGEGDFHYFAISGSNSVSPTLVGAIITHDFRYQIGTDGDWVQYDLDTIQTNGRVIRFRGLNRYYLYDDDEHGPWRINGTNVILSGRMDGLLDYNDPPQGLGNYAFSSMFTNQTSITQANMIMSEAALSTACYQSMFNGCTNLVKAPVLPLNSPKDNSYNSTFKDCISLVDAPALPATTLASGCYNNMFQGCTKLVNAPELPITILTGYCYNNMFAGCTSLVNAPSLPATTLIDHCYGSMFQGCTSLLHVPGNNEYTKLSPAQADMFTGATNVQTDIPWIYIPASFGGGGDYDYFIITNSTDVTPTWATAGDPLQYKLGSNDWVNAVSGTSITTGDVIRFRGTGRNSLYTADTETNAWVINGIDVILSGRLDTLLNWEEPPTSLGDYAFNSMFQYNSSIITANIWMPDSVSSHCYKSMFNSCINLVNVPILIAPTLADNCYFGMFGGCTNLVNAPSLPATTLNDNCYQYMFQNCINLVYGPDLPATTLGSHCYDHMFEGCNKLDVTPELPATTLADNCYTSMFINCNSLYQTPDLPATTLVEDCYAHMFEGCTNLDTALDLPATTLVEDCYGHMFDGCTKLRFALGSDRYTAYPLSQYHMFADCTALIVPLTYEQIPDGWK